MPEIILLNDQGDKWTISLDEGSSVGSTMRVRAGKYTGGTFSAKTPALAFKQFQELVKEEKKNGYRDPEEIATTGKQKKKETALRKTKIAVSQWKKWWHGLSDGWKSALSEAANCDPETDGFAAIAQLDSLDAPEMGFNDLSPLANLVNLRSLNLYGNNFRDLKPLAKLSELKSLYIDNCAEVDDLKPLKQLTMLEELNVGYTSITDLSPLFKLKNLKELSLPGLENQFDDWKTELSKIKAALPNCRIITAE